MELPPSNLGRDQEEKLSIGWKGVTNLSEHSWNSVNHHPKSRSNLYAQPAENLNKNGINGNVIRHESSLFSSSFSEIFSRKLRLLDNDLSCKHASSAASHHEEEPFKSMEEVEAQTIGNLLPDEDDLFSGVIDDVGLNIHASKGDALEDFDLFSSGGGMELEGDDRVSMVPRNSDLIGVFNGQRDSNGLIAGKQIKLEPSCPRGVRRFMQQPESEQDERNLCKSPFDELSSGNGGFTASGCMDNGYSQFVAPVSIFSEPHRSSSVPLNLASPARVASIGKQLSFREPNHSLDKMKFANQGLPSFHPHAVPEYDDSLADGLSFNSSSTITDMVSSASPMMAEGVDGRHIRGARSNGHPMQPNAGVLGSSGMSRNGNHYMWNNSNLHQQDPSSAMVWPNSPSFINGNHANRLPHIPSFSRAPPVMLNVGSPVHHHIGSAPPVNSAFWDKQHPYIGESPETSGFHLGSLGSVGFPSSSLSHPMEFASLSHAAGNCMDLTRSGGVHSPQQTCHHFPGRNPMISMPTSLDSPNDRVKNLSYRRNESNSSNADKKQFELDIDRIIHGEESRTTLMIKNIPNKYTSRMLLAAIDEHCRGTYDFIYLPIDFKNKCNVGYAFINMIDPQHVIPLYKAFNGQKWEKFNSEKVASIAFARIQGKAALITHFQNSSLLNEDKRCRPILFHTNGPNAGDQEPFPMGTNIRPRPRRPRTTGNDENHRQASSSTSANAEEFSNGADSSLCSSKDSD